MNDAERPDPGLAEATAALDILVAAARLGGETAMRYFRPGLPTSAAVRYKAGNSPVTDADVEVDAQLAGVLRAAFPHAGWLSEETEDDPARLDRRQTIVVDPIDGTSGFLSGDPHWTVAIALLEDGRPIAGVVHAPAMQETFAAARGRGATLNGAPIRAAQLAALEGATLAGPRPLGVAFASHAGFTPEFVARAPSLAYRLASVAAGRAAIGVAGPNAHDWDIAAADLILNEAGAGLAEDGREVSYNQRGPRHGPLLAAPAAWIARLAPSLWAASASLRPS